MTTQTDWSFRGYLPHFDSPEAVQSVTFRLNDSLPAELERELETIGRRFGRAAKMRAAEAWLDKGYGACHLKDEQVAQMVENALLFFDGARYDLHEWNVMPNHVHTLFELLGNWKLKSVLHSWKSYTAKKANKILGLEGTFWQEDYFDRHIRDAEHYWNAVEYIRQNPVKAGLVSSPEDWRFGSASRCKRTVDG